MEDLKTTFRNFDLENLNDDDLRELIKVYVDEVKGNLAEEKSFSEAMAIIGEMKEFGIEPDDEMASAMIKKCNTADEVKQILAGCYHCSLDEEACFYVASFLNVQECEEYVAKCLESGADFNKTGYLHFLKKIKSSDLRIKILYRCCNRLPIGIDTLDLYINAVQKSIKTPEDRKSFEAFEAYVRPYKLANEIIAACLDGMKTQEVRCLFDSRISPEEQYDVVQIILSSTCRPKVIDKIRPLILERNISVSSGTRKKIINNVHRRHKKIPKHINEILQQPLTDNDLLKRPKVLDDKFPYERFIASNTCFNKKMDSVLVPEIDEIQNDILSSSMDDQEYFRKKGFISGLQLKYPSAFRMKKFITGLLIKLYMEENIDGIFDLNIAYHLGELEGIKRRQELIDNMPHCEYIPLLFCWMPNDEIMGHAEAAAGTEHRLVRYEIGNLDAVSEPGYLLAKDIKEIQQSVGKLVSEKYQILICLVTTVGIKEEELNAMRNLFAEFDNATVITLSDKIIKRLSLFKILYRNL